MNRRAGETVLELIDVTLGYRRAVPVLKGVDLRVCEREFWFVLGPNGAGKTTLLKGILGQLTPWVGAIRRHPRLCSPEAIGFVPQRCDFNPTLPTTVREFVSLGLVGIRVGRSDRAERLAWALERVGLEDLVGRDYHALSGGLRRRALVARALIRRPGFLVLDEPTAGLDLESREELLGSLAELNTHHGLTVLFVTHDLMPAVRFANRIALCPPGGKLVCGSTAELLQPDRLEKTYGVNVSVSFVDGAVRFGVGEKGGSS